MLIISVTDAGQRWRKEMARRKKIAEPDYKILFKSSVASLMIAYGELKKAMVNLIQYRFVSDDGRFCVFEGEDARMKRIKDLSE